MIRAFFISISLLYAGVAYGQAADSTIVMPFDQFYRLVMANHPVVKQAELLTESAAQQLRSARGGFDPKLEGRWDFKEFKNTEYYDNLDVALKIPTWLPIEPKIGYTRNEGSFISPEDFISEETNNQQIYTGVSVAIGQGLFMDQRRATVRQAEIMQDMAEAEQVKAINKVLLQAAKDYWGWYYAYNNYELLEQSIAIAQDIFDRTQLAFEYGETAVIDTVQAKISLQSRRVDFRQANIERIRASLQLSNHLWTEDGLPLEIQNNVRPEEPVTEFDEGVLGQLVQLARDNHPEIRKLDLKNESLGVDRSLAKENLKPRLDVGYYLLDQPFSPGGEGRDITVGNSYKMDVTFAFPIFLRKARGKLKQIDVKIQENIFQRSFAEREIINEINAEYNSIVNTRNILQQQQEMVNNYQLILDAERLNLQNGESDLFKINVQFDKLINSQTKFFKLKSEYQKNIARLYWAAGVNNLGLQ